MRLLVSLVLLSCSIHIALAITRYDSVSLQGTAPNGVVAYNDGDDAYLGLGTNSRGVLSESLCIDSHDGRIVVINSGGTLSSLPQLAVCSNGQAFPFGAGNTYPDYVLVDSTSSCPEDYHIAEVFDVAIYFQSDKPQLMSGDALATNRVIFKLTAPQIQNCVSGCTPETYTQLTRFTAELDQAGPNGQQNANAIFFDSPVNTDKLLCVWNKAKIQFLPYTTTSSGFPDKTDLNQVCTAQGLTFAPTESLFQYFKSGFDTESAVSFFYLRAPDYGVDHDNLFVDCYQLVDKQTSFYAPIVYIATADSCPNTTNIPMISSGDIATFTTSASMKTDFTTGTYSTAEQAQNYCNDTAGNLWPALSQIILSGKGPTFPDWTTIPHASFYSNPYVACLFEPNFVPDLSRSSCALDDDVPSPLTCHATGLTTGCCNCISNSACNTPQCSFFTTSPPTPPTSPTTTAPAPTTTTPAPTTTTSTKSTLSFHA